jgi:hypothetical protein
MRQLIQCSALLLLASLAAGCADTITFANGSGNETGILIDGQDGGTAVHSRSFVTPANLSGTGSNLTSATAPNLNEVTAFTNERPPKQLNTPWTAAKENFDLAFRNRIQIPVTVWIVKGPFAQQRDHAIDACIRTSQIWRDERMGIDFSPFQIRDATGDPQAAAHFAFPNGDVGDSVWAPLRTDIGFDAGRLNIYWVDTVNGGTGNGWSNFGAQIAMGRNTGDELLSHEIGHALSLTHTDGDGNFNDTNIMWSASNVRQFITEGQLFRAHLNSSSVLNALYAARPGEATRNCSYGAGAPNCPATAKRIWADGTFPAN